MSEAMNVQPVDLKLSSPDRLQIEWSDGEVKQYPIRELRDNCPCASCEEKRSAEVPPTLLPILGSQELAPLRITSMKPTGNYAYGIEFSDGHDTGIFTLELLRSLGTVVS
jgi:DUF971 family protein